jgi:Sigma-70, region 4
MKLGDIKRKLKTLSTREREVLRLRCEALEYKECGERLGIAPTTVQTYYERASFKLDLYEYETEIQRWRFLFQIICPILGSPDSSNLPDDDTDLQGPTPPIVLSRAAADEAFLHHVGRDLLFSLVAEFQPPPPPAPSRLRWFIAGLLVCSLILAGGLYALSKLRPEPSPLLPIIVQRETVPIPVTITPDLNAPTITPFVVTTTPDPNAPTAAPIVQTFVVTQLVTQIVTATPLPATPTPVSTATPETTPPGTILVKGQTWRQGGVELTLKDVKILPDKIEVFFDFRNLKGSEISVKFKRVDNFFASDNNNRKLETCYSNVPCDWDRSYIISSGDTVQITAGNNQNPPIVLVDTTEPDITEVIVKVTSFSSVTEAQWRIPVNH